jgi:CBS domain-containing protein
MAMKRCLARDVMTRDVVCVRAGTNLRELEKIFLEKRISGAPVVDEGERLVGVISQTDLVYYHLTRGDRPFHGSDFYRSAEIERAFEGGGYQIEDYDIGLVGDVMTPVVHTAAPETPATDLARHMAEKRIHRMIITQEEKVVGLVSAMDLLQVIAGIPEEARASAPTPPAAHLRRASAAPAGRRKSATR